MSKQNVSYLYHELEETLANLLELREDGFYVSTNQVIAATYSKVGFLQGIVENNPDFQYRKELSNLIKRIDFFFGITREKTINEIEQEK